MGVGDALHCLQLAVQLYDVSPSVHVLLTVIGHFVPKHCFQFLLGLKQIENIMLMQNFGGTMVNMKMAYCIITGMLHCIYAILNTSAGGVNSKSTVLFSKLS